ncbi:MAG: hypothetical protein HQ594_06260 [Candidatus Omnitrophica bacterium]|nr:hypothetical protein [Candidatus Omnitrophota bacterium]
MSIITDALKKAQKKRTLLETATQGDDAPLRINLVGDDSARGEKSKTSSRTFALISIVVFGVILLVAILSLTNFLRHSSGKYTPGASKESTASAITSYGNAAEPARPFGFTKTSPAINKHKLPVLNGIMYSPSHPQAIINGSIVAEGAAISGFSVVRILPDTVTLSSGNDEVELRLK